MWRTLGYLILAFGLGNWYGGENCEWRAKHLTCYESLLRCWHEEGECWHQVHILKHPERNWQLPR